MPSLPPEERKTDPSSLRPEDGGVSVIVPRAANVPSDGLRPDPNSYSDQAMHTVIQGMAELKAARSDIGNLLDLQTATLTLRLDESDRRNAANYALVVNRLQSLVHSVDAVTGRVSRVEDQVDKVEAQQETSADRMERMLLDMAAFRTETDQRFALMAREIETIKRAAG